MASSRGGHVIAIDLGAESVAARILEQHAKRFEG
jgi:hypothetical protein